MDQFDIDIYKSPFSWDPELNGGLGVYFLVLGLWAVLGGVVLCVCPSCRRLRSMGVASRPGKKVLAGGEEEDKDVAAERIKLQCGGTTLYDSVLQLMGIGRDYSSPPITAVADLYLALARGECFSLLGVNGAGKTTTFRCLTGDLSLSRGQILVDGVTLGEALTRPRPMMGYCPQTQALDPNLTPKEALKIMALIRGFPGDEIQEVVNRAVGQLGLEEEADRYASRLSGGSQRKLSTALALLGDPLLVLLDEPTTGMDPASRRMVWTAVRNVTQSGRTVLLTSHSMDEVDQLSHRMGIMVNGHLVCLGSPHYLKLKHGDKYTIRLKTKNIEDLSQVIDFLRVQLTHVLLKEQHHLSLVLEVPRVTPLRAIFDTLATTLALGVTEYDVSQTTLNQVFRILTSYQSDGQTHTPARRESRRESNLPTHLHSLLPAGPASHPHHPRRHSRPRTPTDILDPPTHPHQPDLPTHTPPQPHLASTPRIPTERPNPHPHPQTLTPVEYEGTEIGRTSFYDNVDGDSGNGGSRQASPESGSVESGSGASGSADSSPDEVWTHL